MKLFKGMLSAKGRNGHDELDREGLQRDLAEGGFESPLVGRHRTEEIDFADANDDDWLNDDDAFGDEQGLIDPDLVPPKPAEAEAVPETVQATADGAAGAEAAPVSRPVALDEDDDDNIDWNIGLEPVAELAPEIEMHNEQVFEEPDYPDPGEIDLGLEEAELPPVSRPVSQAPADYADDVFDFGIEEAEQIEQAALEAVETEQGLSEDEKEALIAEIRIAMDAVRHIRSDEEAGRQAAARDELGRDASNADRILDTTNDHLDEDQGARRRKAIALMKAAAAATRADPILQDMAGRDPTADPAHQRDYRSDLAKMEPPALEPAKSRIENVQPPEPEADAVEPLAAEDTDAQGMELAEKQAQPPEETADWADADAEPDETDPEPLGTANTPIKSGHKRIDLEESGEDTAAIGLRAALRSARPDEPATGQHAPEEPSDSPEIQPTLRPVSEPADWTKSLAAMTGADPAPAEAPAKNVVEVPAPAMGRAGRSAGRVKTRLLGFHHAEDDADNVFDQKAAPKGGASAMFPVGWVVVADGPGRGNSFALTGGVAQIGRGEDQTVRLDFGDNAISRQNHAAIAFDDEAGQFYLGHGGKSNLVRLNGKPVLATEELNSGDEIRLGETRLRFVALCNEEFGWNSEQEGPAGHAAIA